MMTLATLIFRGFAPSFGQASASLRFNADWWSHAKNSEQQGFIYGYLDCRQYPNAAEASISDYQNSVIASLQSQQLVGPNSVTEAIHHASSTLPSRDEWAGEKYRGPHGFLDGEWWGSFTGAWPPDVTNSDRGYLEGYLACAAPPVAAQVVHRYQAAINRHYRAGYHEHDKIADVLQALLKRSSAP